MTGGSPTEAEFRKRLAAIGLPLDGPAFNAALAGARRLRAQVVEIESFLAQLPRESKPK